MLALFKHKKSYKDAARNVYAMALSSTRSAEFYERYGVPDSFDGRFDLLVLHVFLVFNRMLKDDRVEAEAFNQALFDVTFEDMDQTLREMGIGDMGVPKHQRRMMTGFNGRMHVYETALAQKEMPEALKRNLYGTIDSPDEKILDDMVVKINDMIHVLNAQNGADILNGQVRFLL